MSEYLSVTNRLLDRVEITGPDAGWFLNGQISADVEQAEIGVTQASLALTPQGKVVAWFRIKKLTNDKYQAFVAHGFGENLLKRLEMFAIRTDVKFISSELEAVSVRATSEKLMSQSLLKEELLEKEIIDCLWSNWFGVDVLDAKIADEVGQYTKSRMLAGIPAMGIEVTSGTIPASAGLVEKSVSFTKGCYVGQEQVARIDSRNVKPPTRLVKVNVCDKLEVDLPADLYQGDMVVGSLTSYFAGDEKTVGLGFVKRSFEGGPVSVGALDGSLAEILNID